MIIIIAMVFYYFYEKKDNLLNLVFFDVGQGDAILIKTPNEKNILIDGGPDSDYVEKLGNYLAYRANKIDLVIITHAHRDHYLGLIEIIKKYKPKNIIYSGVDANFTDYLYMKKIIENLNINLIIPKISQKYEIENDLDFEIIYMPNTKTVENLNDSSISIKLNYKNFNAVLTGDASCEIEKQILKNKNNLQAEIFKAGHHGSKYSNCDNILKAIKPEITIIQLGIDNKFGHPHQDALNRILKINSKILRNDQSGDIIIKSDGINYFTKFKK